MLAWDTLHLMLELYQLIDYTPNKADYWKNQCNRQRVTSVHLSRWLEEEPVAYRAQVPPRVMTSNAALSGKKCFLRWEKMSTNSQKFLTTFFLVIHPKNENCTRNELCRPRLACATPNFQLFCPFLPKILPFFTFILPFLRKFSHISWKCRPFGSAARGDSPPLTPPWYATERNV